MDVFCSGSTKLTKTKGEHALTILDNLSQNTTTWKDKSLVSEKDSHVETVNKEKKHCDRFFVDHEIEGDEPCHCGLNEEVCLQMLPWSPLSLSQDYHCTEY